MVDFLLIHGSFGDAREWERLVPLLRSDPRVGKVVVPDLPGRGSNRPRQFSSIRLGDYLDTVVCALHEHDLQDVILVGHSAGGMFLQPAAAAEPERIRRMVFLAAAVLEPGRSFLDLQPCPLRALIHTTMWLFRAKQRGMAPLVPAARWALGPDLLPEDRAKTPEYLCTEPQALTVGCLEWPVERVRAPATYICTTKDRVVSPKNQRRMARKLARAELIELPMGHASPVLYPEKLASILLGFA